MNIDINALVSWTLFEPTEYLLMATVVLGVFKLFISLVRR